MDKNTGLFASSVISLTFSLAAFAARFASSIVVARSLGVEGKGTYTLTILISAMLVLFLDLGFSGAITYLTASGQHKPADLFNFLTRSSLVLGFIGGLGFYIIFTIFLSKNLLADISPDYILLISLTLPINIFVAYLSALMLGLQEIFKYNLISIVRTFSNLLFQIVSALLGGGIPGAIWSYVLANIIAFFLSLILSRPWARFYLFDLKPILRKCLSFGSRSYITNLTSFFNYRLDNFILNYYSGPANVGLYSTSVATAELILYIPNAVSIPTFPKSASLERSASAKLTARLCRYSILIIVPSAVIFGFFGTYLIPLIYGDAFQSATIPFLLLLPGILGVSLTKIISANLSGIGKPQYATYASIVTIFVTIILDILLIPRQGINGAAVASTASYLLAAILLVYRLTVEASLSWKEVVIPTTEDLFFVLKRTYQFLSIVYEKTKAYFQAGGIN